MSSKKRKSRKKNSNRKRKTDPQKPSWSLTRSEWSTLDGFRRDHKTRYFARTIMVFLLLYCLVVASTSSYYAYKMFTGADISDKIQALGDDSNFDKYARDYAQALKPIVEKLDFLGVGFTAILHSVLLIYIAARAFIRLRRWRRQTPRAKLVIKLARRLEELGQLDLKEKVPVHNPSREAD